MTQNGRDPEIVEEVTVTGRMWADVDLDEQEYLDRLASFGEGYFDLSTFLGLNESGDLELPWA